MYICSRCYYSGLPTEDTNNKSGGFSGFISSLFGSGQNNQLCPKCEKESMVSLTTDQGKEIMDSITK